MTVQNLIDSCGFEPINVSDPDRIINSCYCGDLLSWVMGRAQEGNAWITIMSNINVIAVASLTDVSCVVFAEGVKPDEDIINTAKEKGINLLISADNTYHTATKIFGIIDE